MLGTDAHTVFSAQLLWYFATVDTSQPHRFSRHTRLHFRLVSSIRPSGPLTWTQDSEFLVLTEYNRFPTFKVENLQVYLYPGEVFLPSSIEWRWSLSRSDIRSHLDFTEDCCCSGLLAALRLLHTSWHQATPLSSEVLPAAAGLFELNIGAVHQRRPATFSFE